MAEEAASRFQSIDWTSENERLEALLSVGMDDCCKPGMGLVIGDGYLLHLMPEKGGSLRWIFDRPPSGWFWIDLVRRTSVDAHGSMPYAFELIAMLYEHQFEALWRRSMTARVRR